MPFWPTFSIQFEFSKKKLFNFFFPILKKNEFQYLGEIDIRRKTNRENVARQSLENSTKGFTTLIVLRIRRGIFCELCRDFWCSTLYCLRVGLLVYHHSNVSCTFHVWIICLSDCLPVSRPAKSSVLSAFCVNLASKKSTTCKHVLPFALVHGRSKLSRISKYSSRNDNRYLRASHCDTHFPHKKRAQSSDAYLSQRTKKGVFSYFAGPGSRKFAGLVDAKNNTRPHRMSKHNLSPPPPENENVYARMFVFLRKE